MAQITITIPPQVEQRVLRALDDRRSQERGQAVIADLRDEIIEFVKTFVRQEEAREAIRAARASVQDVDVS